jgi:hypothetical protein
VKKWQEAIEKMEMIEWFAQFGIGLF